jgi:hypothetical protein
MQVPPLGESVSAQTPIRLVNNEVKEKPLNKAHTHGEREHMGGARPDEDENRRKERGQAAHQGRRGHWVSTRWRPPYREWSRGNL